MIRLNTLSELSGCEILAKAEFMNPGGSVKDRAATFIIKVDSAVANFPITNINLQDAEEKGLLKPGGTVVEGTAGIKITLFDFYIIPLHS